MQQICYVAEGKLYINKEGKTTPLAAGAVDTYKQTVKELEKRREWKHSGTGAAFTGTLQHFGGEIYAQVEAVAAGPEDKLIYAAALESSGALYSKNPDEPDEAEGYILRRTDTRFYHMDYDPQDGYIVCSANDGYVEKHLALCHWSKGDFRYLSEGESVELMPAFSRRDNKIIHFSSAGFYLDPKSRRAIYSNYSIGRFDLRANELEECFSDPKYDYLHPREMADGTLYCIRRPKEAQVEKGPSVTDILLVPVRIVRAFFGWLNFFSQKYTGESLVKKTKGNNPAKYKEPGEEELFIEGNLINATKEQKENALQGEQFPGIAPRSWELVTLDSTGVAQVVKKGVLDYTVDGEGNIFYSNGRYILCQKPSGEEEKVCEAKVARCLCTR